MESQSYSSSSSTATYLSSYSNQGKKAKQQPQPPPTFQSALHSVRKLPAKPWKMPIAPLPPIPPRVYKVDSENFKQVVQKLTGAPEFRSRRLQSVAPPPLSLSTTATSCDTDKTSTLDLLPSPNITTPLSATYREFMNETLMDSQPRKQPDSLAAVNPFAFSLSPTSHAWCSFPLLSPGTLSSLEQVL